MVHATVWDPNARIDFLDFLPRSSWLISQGSFTNFLSPMGMNIFLAAKNEGFAPLINAKMNINEYAQKIKRVLRVLA